ncbi:hypothetical protein [Microbacterium sp.]|uniref:hypothetical protein n=1 Tax=Microbacterium sp. TaxID=51671 RepID=UPI003A8440E2
MNRAARAVAALTLAVGLGLAGCGVVTDPNGTPQVQLPTSLPEVTLPTINVQVDNSGGGSSSEDPPSGSAGQEDSSSAQDSTPRGHDIWSIVATVLIVLIALAAVFALLGRARRHREEDNRRHDVQNRALNDLLTVSRWAVDQSRQLESARTPARFVAAGPSLSSHLIDAETRAARLSGQVRDADLAGAIGALATALSALRGAMIAFLNAADDEARIPARRDALTAAREGVESAVREVIPHVSSL